ncbi:MAG TPA: exosortase/archaeosortase family protein [Candidatus Sulfotelmatobacter sp.]|nr:exosortase/archaeosortase family protein [Candidatus Sulfotelmatobacter sp.]
MTDEVPVARNIVRGLSSPPAAVSQSSPNVRFSVVVAISLLLWWKPLVSSFALALSSDQYTHILLILPVSLTLICLEWKGAACSSELRSPFNYILLPIAVAAAAIARFQILPPLPDQRLAANMLALVVCWIVAFRMAFGSRAFQRALFPLCFLLWMVPIPEVLLSPIIRGLQEGSTASARILFASYGIPVAQDGTLLAIPGLTIEVARECSSIRSSLMLVVTTMVLAQLGLRSAWRKALVVAVAVPLSIAKNGLRIFVLGMLTTRVDRSYIDGRLHHQGGIIYFLLALAAIALLICAARYGEKKSLLSPSRD